MINNKLFSRCHSKVMMIGRINIQISLKTPDPICLRIKFTFDLLFRDFITEHHIFLSFFIAARTLSNNVEKFGLFLYWNSNKKNLGHHHLRN